MQLNERFFQSSLQLFFEEDDLNRNFTYLNALPDIEVTCHLKIKDDMVLCGLPFFFETLNYLSDKKIDYKKFQDEFEGKEFKKSDDIVIKFKHNFRAVLTAERIALNLLQRSSSIATYTKKYVDLANKKEIRVLDTRKTLPGYRALEKYAVNVGGGYNHRFGQGDCWMIKDNHKYIFGGLKEAYEFFQGLHGFYTPIVAEVHTMEELIQAIDLGIRHVMLDNLTPEEINKAVSFKKKDMTYEVSGGITLDTLSEYLIDGVDAISIGRLTYRAPSVDLSLKYYKDE